MKPDEYLELATKTEPSLEDYERIAKRITPQTMRLLHAAMGLCTEAGEFLDALKKHIMYGKPIDETNLAEELGDSNWYEAIALSELQRSFEGIWERNIAKLKARYGDKFNEEGAINRNLEVEREILENNKRMEDFKTRFGIEDQVDWTPKVHYQITGSTACGISTEYNPNLQLTKDFTKLTCELCVKAGKVKYSKDICGNE